MKQDKEKSSIPSPQSTFQWAGKIFFRSKKAREKSDSFTLYKSQLTKKAWWSCLGSLNMNSLGGGQGGHTEGRDRWEGGSGFQQAASKKNRKPAHKGYFCLHDVGSELNHLGCVTLGKQPQVASYREWA